MKMYWGTPHGYGNLQTHQLLLIYYSSTTKSSILTGFSLIHPYTPSIFMGPIHGFPVGLRRSLGGALPRDLRQGHRAGHSGAQSLVPGTPGVAVPFLDKLCHS